MRRFLAFFILKAPQFVQQTRYIPLPQHAYEVATLRAKERKLSTAFGGRPAIGLTLDDLVKHKLELLPSKSFGQLHQLLTEAQWSRHRRRVD